MITITVETDEEETAVLAALQDGSLNDVLGRSLLIKRGRNTIGGSSETTAVMHSGASDPGMVAGGGGGGYVTEIRSFSGDGD